MDLTFLHLLRVELRCKLQEKLHCVTGLLVVFFYKILHQHASPSSIASISPRHLDVGNFSWANELILHDYLSSLFRRLPDVCVWGGGGDHLGKLFPLPNSKTACGGSQRLLTCRGRSNFQNHNYYIYCTDCEVRIRKFLNVAVKQGIL